MYCNLLREVEDSLADCKIFDDCFEADCLKEPATLVGYKPHYQPFMARTGKTGYIVVICDMANE